MSENITELCSTAEDLLRVVSRIMPLEEGIYLVHSLVILGADNLLIYEERTVLFRTRGHIDTWLQDNKHILSLDGVSFCIKIPPSRLRS
jgi:hypothetical protein